MRNARAAVVDTALAAVLEEMQIHAHDITDIDEVTPLLPVCKPVRPTEKACLPHLHNLMVELVEDRRHLALVMLLGTVDVEVPQTDNQTARLGDDLPYIAVEREL